MNMTKFQSILASVIVLTPALSACTSEPPQAALPSVTVSQSGPCCGPVTAAGRHLLKVIDESDVEHLWLYRRHIDWKTGIPDMSEEWHGRDSETHCSAYVAGMSVRLGVYLMRPPQHGLSLLANAQGEWLDSSAGRRAGWHRVESVEQVQYLANQGWFVVGVYVNPDPKQSGHIVIVRPSDTATVERLEGHGPQVAEASYHNHINWSVKGSFAKEHYADVHYYAHDVPDTVDPRF